MTATAPTIDATPNGAKRPRPVLTRAEYLAAVGAERFPAAEHGRPCYHEPAHVIIAPDPAPDATGQCIVILDCAPLDARAR